MARIDTSGISGYETMSAEEKLAALEEFEFNDNASEVSRLKDALSKANKEAGDLRKERNQLMSEDERKKQENEEAIQQMQQELEELKREKFTSQYNARALAIGMDEKTAETVSVSIVSGEFEKVFDAFGKFLKTHDHEIEVKLLQDTPRAPGSDGDKPITKKEFREMSLEDRLKFSQENPEEYKSLYGGN